MHGDHDVVVIRVAVFVSQETTLREKSPEIETVIDRHLSQQTQLTTVGSLSGLAPELDTRTQPSGVNLWNKVLYNRPSSASISSFSSHQGVNMYT